MEESVTKNGAREHTELTEEPETVLSAPPSPSSPLLSAWSPVQNYQKTASAFRETGWEADLKVKEFARPFIFKLHNKKQKLEGQRLQPAQSPSVNWGEFLEPFSGLPAPFKLQIWSRWAYHLFGSSLYSVWTGKIQLKHFIGIFT